jgi:hypothetical protein
LIQGLAEALGQITPAQSEKPSELSVPRIDSINNKLQEQIQGLLLKNE